MTSLRSQGSTDLAPIAAEVVHPTPLEPQSDAPIAAVSAPKKVQAGAGQVFLSTFITIFLAEFGDKTQLTTMLMSAESHAPWVVFLGAGSALIATSLFGVWLGRVLAQRVSPRTLEIAAGILLLGIAVFLIGDIVVLS